MSYGVTNKRTTDLFLSQNILKQLSIELGEIQISLNLKWYNVQQFWTNGSKVCLVVKVCLEIVQQVMGKNDVNYNFILNK